jgi:hypothetical protein
MCGRLFFRALGLLLLVGATATWRQLRLSREGQITERFTKAIDQLDYAKSLSTGDVATVGGTRACLCSL